jgi:hypothetical protein
MCLEIPTAIGSRLTPWRTHIIIKRGREPEGRARAKGASEQQLAFKRPAVLVLVRES